MLDWAGQEIGKGGDQRKIKYPETKDPLLDGSPIDPRANFPACLGKEK